MQTATEDDLPIHADLLAGRSDAMDTFTHTECSLENEPPPYQLKPLEAA